MSRKGYPYLSRQKAANWPSRQWDWVNDVGNVGAATNVRVTLSYLPGARYEVYLVVGLRKSHQEWLRTRGHDYWRYPGQKRTKFVKAKDTSAKTAGEAQAIATQMIMDMAHATFNEAIVVTAPFNKYDNIDFPHLGPKAERQVSTSMYRNPGTPDIRRLANSLLRG